MRPRCCPTATAFFHCLSAFGLALACTPDAGAAPPPADEVERLIRQLGSDRFAEREAAARRLGEADESSLEALRRAAADGDAEVRRRARGLVRRLEIRLYGERLCLTGHRGPVVALARSPDGRWALSGGDDCTARLWDLKTGKELLRLGPVNAECWAVAFTPDGRQAVSAAPGNTLALWDLDTGKEVRRFESARGQVRAVCCTPDGKRVLAGCYDRTLHAWDVETGKEVWSGRHADNVMCVACSPDGWLAVTGSGQADRTVRIWDVATGKELHRLRGHTERVMGVAFSPDGRRVASGSWDGTVRVWDVESGKEVRTIALKVGHVFGVAFSDDGRRLAAAGGDGTVRILDAATGRELRCCERHSAHVSEVKFVAGDRVLSCGGDGMLRAWDVPR